ncbi:expressed unknown protein [Seminavis robusta]|uniref:Uncharacterized protein n=1 Tax=Seminavis robusta TaxID=568900 RepID=A0A9N8HMK8_9STRA|nr:expressed unknown protein [Seminavis robusta]|eukprot:Sro753_g197390.1 n/a (347) ;mRNA; f:28876-29916
MATPLEKSLVLVPKFTGGLSMIGSCLICWTILKDPRANFRKSYHRLMFGIGFGDVFYSLTMFLSTWPIPKDDPNAPWLASGNEATCLAQGFVQVLFAPTPYYNAFLGIYYASVVVYSWPETRIFPYEMTGHAVALIFGVTTSIIALVQGKIGNAVRWCTLIDIHFALLATVLWQWVACIVLVVSMTFLWWKASGQFRRTQRYGEAAIRKSQAQDHAASATGGSNTMSSSTTENRSTPTTNPMQLITTQAFLYAAAYFVTQVPSFIWTAAYYINPQLETPAWIQLFIVIAYPLQGFWNCLIYFRPRYLQHQQRKRQEMARSTKASEGMPSQFQPQPQTGGHDEVEGQ